MMLFAFLCEAIFYILLYLLMKYECFTTNITCADPHDRTGGGGQVALGFLRNSGTDPLEKQLLLEAGLYCLM